MAADSQWIYQTKQAGLTGRRVRLREVRTDLDGYLAELLSKSVSAGALEESLTKDDAERLLAHLKALGRLDDSGTYRGQEMRGPDADGPDRHDNNDGEVRYTPLPLSELLGSKAGSSIHQGYEYQPTMLQIVGGSDRLPQALADRLRRRIIYRAAAKQIRQHEHGVSVAFTDDDGDVRTLEADYLVCAIPLIVLKDIDTDFESDFKAAIASVPYSAAGKMGLQFKRRFWEEDDQIFGGATKTDQDIAQVVYPSHGFLTRKGIVTGYYIQGQGGRPVGDMSPGARLSLALEQGTRIHPQYPAEFESSFSVAWHRVRWSKGSWSVTPADVKTRLNQPDRRVYLAGDHLNLNAWMQGAFESARLVASAIHTRAMSERKPA